MFLHRWNFRFNTICRSLRNGDLFIGPKDYCWQFFADSGKYVSTAAVNSSNGIKSFFYSNNDDDFFSHRWNFRLNTICRSLRNGDLFTDPKDYCSQFFAYSAKYVSTATVHSSNGIKSFFYSNNDDDFFLHRWNFRLNTICRSLRNGYLFTGPKNCFSQFFADSAKYVSTATVDSSNRMKSLFYSKNNEDFFLHCWNFHLNTTSRSLRNGDLFTGPKDCCLQIFYGFRKVRFHLYSRQFKWNQVVLLPKQWQRLLLASLKLSFKYHLWKPQKWGFIYWSKRLFFTIFLRIP